MKISMNTSYSDKTGIEAILRQISEAGFSSVQWIHDWDNDYIYSESEIEQIRSWLEKYNLVMSDVHASKGIIKDYMSFDEYRRKAGVDLIKNRVDLARYCGADAVILHMPVPNAFWNSSTLDDMYSQVFRSLDELEPYCREKGVRIAVENLVLTDFQKEVSQFTTLFQRYDKDFLGMCYDSGHANCSFKNPGESIRFLEMFMGRVISMHLTDNDGKEDRHWLPLTGTVDWDGILRLIAKSGYDRFVTLEAVIWRSGLEDESVYLAECYKRARLLNEMAEKCAADR